MKNEITEIQKNALEQKIYDLLMENPEMGMGEMGECRDAANRIVDEWIEENGIEVH